MNEPAQVSARTTLRNRGQVTLPAEVRAALHVEEGDDLEFTIDDSGHVSVRGLRLVPTDQAWFWTEEWQRGEREATAQIAAGRLKTFESGADFLDSLGS